MAISAAAVSALKMCIRDSGNGGALVDVVDAEGQNGRAQHQPEQPFQREIGNKFFEWLHSYLTYKVPPV